MTFHGEKLDSGRGAAPRRLKRLAKALPMH
jgi:hypothetical protein